MASELIELQWKNDKLSILIQKNRDIPITHILFLVYDLALPTKKGVKNLLICCFTTGLVYYSRIVIQTNFYSVFRYELNTINDTFFFFF